MKLTRLDRAAMQLAYLQLSLDDDSHFAARLCAHILEYGGVVAKSIWEASGYVDWYESYDAARLGHVRLVLLLRVLLREPWTAYEYDGLLFDNVCHPTPFVLPRRPKRYRAAWELAPAFDPDVTPKMRRERRAA